MEGSVGAPPQRVCPKCARISWATGPQCPYCNARFRRRQGIAPWMLVATAAAIIVIVAIMFVIAGNQLDHKLNDRVDEVNRKIIQKFDQIRKDVQQQVQKQGATVPPVATPTPAPFTTPTPSPEGEGGTTTPAPSQTDSPSSAETATPTPTIGP